MNPIETLINAQIQTIERLQDSLKSACNGLCDADVIASYAAALRDAIEGYRLLQEPVEGLLEVDRAIAAAIDMVKQDFDKAIG